MPKLNTKAEPSSKKQVLDVDLLLLCKTKQREGRQKNIEDKADEDSFIYDYVFGDSQRVYASSQIRTLR